MTNEKLITNAELMNEAEWNQVAGGKWRPPGVACKEFVPPAFKSVAYVKNFSTDAKIHLKDWRDY